MTLAIAVWNYHERTDPRTANGVISDWTRGLQAKARARLDRSLDQLRQLPKAHWSKPYPASNIGDHTYVIRFKDVTGGQLRVFGHFFDPHRSFVMTSTGYEKDNVYYPRDYQKVAKRHKTECDEAFPAKTVKFRHYCALCEP